MARPARYSDAELQAATLAYYDQTGDWPTVRQLRAAGHIGIENARRSIEAAQLRRTKGDLADNPYFAALAWALEMSPEEALDHLDKLDRRHINPANGNTHVSRRDLVMVLGMQQPHADSKKMTKKALLKQIINPAARWFNRSLGDRARTEADLRGKPGEGYEERITPLVQALLDSRK